ncbi:HlyD family efflux transporter periplasmic adaptor subunit [Rhodanobacter sp. OR87]|uniref:efflux RND transporter periplasmic adaptor subunit n=1 Tax=Rhodanobacter sp. OR87 TaxID=1076523 RepID=UPI000406BB3B|nr:HlyD family efflux transporter periplasmic adaptor subunit [Rhodanobacter sp. OR87]
MDIANPLAAQRKRRRRRIAVVAAALLLAALAIGAMNLGPALPAVERSSLWIDTVQRGDMLREVRAPGTLVPRDIHWLAAETSAQVAKIEVWPGTHVEADTILLRLASPQVENDLRNAQAQVVAAEARVAAKHAELQSQLLDERSSLAQAQAEYASAQVKSEADAKAMAKNLIPRVQYEQEQIALKQLQHRIEVEQQRVQTFDAGIKAQMAAVQAELQLQRSNLTLRQRQSDALDVRAGIAGTLQQMAVQEGQQVAAGTNLARVARGDVLIARLRVPEVQAKDVAQGMPVQVNTYNGMIDGTVTRIDPAVVDGSVQVDVTPTGSLPAGARPDLSVDGRIRIAKLDQVLSLGRPAQVEANSEVSLFRLDASGATATRIKVRVGAISVDRVQLLQGLHPGDRVILSETSQWDKYDRLRLR